MENLVVSKNYLAVDLGGESGRVVAGCFDGQKVRLFEQHRFLTGAFQFENTLRWDVNRIWSEIQAGLGVASINFPEADSIGVDSWGVDYALLDANEQLIELPWHYRDSRNVGTLSRILDTVTREDIFSSTGIQFMEINTLCQLYASRSAGDSLERTTQLLTIADYFHWCLCGSKSAEFTFATTTQCYDPTEKDWCFALLDRLEIPTRILPNVVQPGTHLGTIRESVKQQTDAGDLSVVAPATHDTASAVVAVPVSESVGANWAYISSGTWSLVGMEVDQPVLSAEALAANVTNEGGVEGTWRLLKNVMGLWLVQRLRLALSERGFSRTYEELAKLAGDAKSAECFIDPDDPSFLNPDNMEEAIGQFCRETNQTVPTDEGALVRCVLESLALRYSEVLDEVSKLSDTRIDVIHVVGGGCKNILLNQFIAGATQLPVVAGPDEATSMGNVMVQCKASGELDSLSDIRNVVRNSVDLIEFEPTAQTYWRDAMASFKQVCEVRRSQLMLQRNR